MSEGEWVPVVDWQYGRAGLGKQQIQIVALMIRVLVAVLLLCPLLTEIAPITAQLPLSLRQLDSREGGKGTLFARALSFLAKTHPQLGHYMVVATRKVQSRGDQAFTANLQDFHFELASANKRVLAIVTVSVGGTKEFVSISPFVLALPEGEDLEGMGNYWISQTVPTGDPAPITNNPVPSYPLENMPGGYRPVQDLADREVQVALDFVAAEHPNMVNYRVEGASYQVVAGLNIRVEYSGLDKYSKVVALVGLDLRQNPKMVAFGIVCGETTMFCSNTAVWEYFNSIESMLVRHPQLLSYRIARLLVKEKPGGQLLNVKVTLANEKKGLSTIAEMDVQKTQSTVQSFFTYSQ